MRCSERVGVVLLGVILVFSASVTAYANCGEAGCVPAQAAYLSHFTGTDCTGAESYYLPDDGYRYSCRSWDGGGACGTIQRTVTSRSYWYNGTCYDAWPSGNTLNEFVTTYRATPPPPPPFGSLRVVTLNTHLISDLLAFTNAPCLSGRGRLIGRMLAQGTGDRDYDVVMFQELFNNGAKDRIIEEAGSKYPYRIFKKPPATSPVGTDQNGGTAILSKFPFLRVAPVLPPDRHCGGFCYSRAWDECDNNRGPLNIAGDCSAQKGWVHTRIDFHGIPVNIISLHTQANYEDGENDYTWTQQQQMLQLKQYIDRFPRSGWEADLSSELVILGGDYNVRGGIVRANSLEPV